ncbi:hypothetical protein AX279_19540 [Pseudomonas sp. J237]|nr:MULTISPECIES: Lar family restriction alleviation protein [Pseudomonas]OEO24029.1 hypothetical protein AX279_19540 [Pseudomonas sp. J237]
MSELKACPFCNNSTDFLIERIDLSSSVVICQGMVDEHCACLARGPIGLQDDDGEEQPGKAAAIREWNSRALPKGYALVPVDQLKKIHRDLDACQKLIWANMRGCDPAYYEDALVSLAHIEAMLAAAQEVE